jgi:hypothetical protein
MGFAVSNAHLLYFFRPAAEKYPRRDKKPAPLHNRWCTSALTHAAQLKTFSASRISA